MLCGIVLTLKFPWFPFGGSRWEIIAQVVTKTWFLELGEFAVVWSLGCVVMRMLRSMFLEFRRIRQVVRPWKVLVPKYWILCPALATRVKPLNM